VRPAFDFGGSKSATKLMRFQVRIGSRRFVKISSTRKSTESSFHVELVGDASGAIKTLKTMS
jgi:hypothetical protein